jgi:hypothetical protein
MRILTPLFILALLFVPLLTVAQPGNPDVDPDVPISGIEFLLGGGALLGIRQLWAKAKSSLKK